MDYMTIKDISAKFAIPERTVYYHLANKEGIRTKKQWRTKLIHIADFAKACGIQLQSLQAVAGNDSENKSQSSIAKMQNVLQNLQKENQYSTDKILALQKVNTNLEMSLNEFVQLHSDEKKERKALMEKVEKYAKKYNLLLGICLALWAFLLIQNVTPLLSFVQ